MSGQGVSAVDGWVLLGAVCLGGLGLLGMIVVAVLPDRFFDWLVARRRAAQWRRITGGRS